MSIVTMLKLMAPGMVKTCAIFFFTLLFSLPLGLIFTFLHTSKNRVISGIMHFIISVLRGTPLMLQLIAVNFGPWYLFGIETIREKLIPVVIAFSINYAAYFSEIYRGGIESISVGQYEGATVLGYSKAQTFFRIILPQVVKTILPSVTNEIITLVKDTSLASTLSYAEIFLLSQQYSNTIQQFTPLLVAGVFYYVFNLVVTVVMSRVEKKMSYYKI